VIRGPLSRDGAGGLDSPSAPGAAVSRVTALLVACALLAACDMRRPNVIVIVMDTTRADHMGFQGYSRATTPRLDAFAKDATQFRDAWSPANWTGPSHASLFTGLRPEHHGLQGETHPYLGPGIPTLAERLAAAGYATACFSNNTVVSPAFGLTRGFSRVEILAERTERVRPWARETHEAAAAWARTVARDGQPFFLFVNDMEAHLPYAPDAEATARFVRGAPKRAEFEAARAWGYPRFLAYDAHVEDLTAFEIGLLTDLYDAEIATLDAEIGALFDALRRDGLLDTTVVVVAADHGENLGDHHLYEHAFGLHRTLLHVPLLVRCPGRLAPGRVVDDVVRLEDVFPTVLDACELQVPADLDGVSLLGNTSGRVARASQPRMDDHARRIQEIYGKVDVSRLACGVRSVHEGPFHLIAYDDGREELFDLRTDPEERADLAQKDPATATRLRALLPPDAASARPVSSPATSPR
jgi:arylsulfatase A-like enzyme